jgi:ParB-like chromosome segregation protein Spo0J
VPYSHKEAANATIEHAASNFTLHRAFGMTKTSEKQIDSPKIEIDDEFRDLLPPLTPEEYSALEDNILREKLREKLLVWKEKGILVDGHNRYAICKKHKIPYDIRVQSFESRERVKLWIVENQASRRNISKFQRAVVMLALEPVFAAIAKEGQKAGGGAVHQKSDEPTNTLEKLAKLAGVSHDTMHKIKFILEKAAANPKDKGLKNQIDALHRGDTGVSINSVYKEHRTPKRKKKAKTSAISKAKPKSNKSASSQPPPNTRPMSEARRQARVKAKQIMPRGLSTFLAEEVDTMLATLENFEEEFSKVNDRTYFYEAVNEWVRQRKNDQASKHP